MIEQLRFQNFMRLKDVSIDLGRLTVLLGPNGSGKTSIMRGISLLCGLAKKHPFEVMKANLPASSLRTADTVDDVGLCAGGTWDSIPGTLSMRIRHQDEKTQDSPNGDVIDIERHWGSTEPLEWSVLIEQPEHYLPVKDKFLTRFEQSVLFNFNVEALCLPTEQSKVDARIEENGKGLTAALQNILLDNRHRFAELEKAAGRVVPDLRGIRFKKPVFSGYSHELCLDFENAPNVPARAISEGTLITLGVLTSLFTVSDPTVVCIENMGHGLHPKAMSALVAQLRKILDEYPHVQIVATTHSPYMIDHFQGEEVRVLSLDTSGNTVCKALTEHPEYHNWKDRMNTGEFWSTVGEKWVTEQPDEEQHKDDE